VKPGIEMRRKAVETSSLWLRQAKDLFGDLLATEVLEKVPGFWNRSFPLRLRSSFDCSGFSPQRPVVGSGEFGGRSFAFDDVHHCGGLASRGPAFVYPQNTAKASAATLMSFANGLKWLGKPSEAGR
jgi:hypothetical protein